VAASSVGQRAPAREAAPAPSGGAVASAVLEAEPDFDEVERVERPKIRAELPMLGWLIAVLIGTHLVGIGLTGIAFAVVYLLVTARERIRIAIPSAIVIGVFFYYVFINVLAIVLPPTVFHLSLFGLKLT
jgi:hypothetical protein